MSEHEKTFVDLCFEGQADPKDIDQYVELWHKSDDGRSLAEFLGFSDEEYALWVEKPRALRHILSAKKNRMSPRQALRQSAP